MLNNYQQRQESNIPLKDLFVVYELNTKQDNTEMLTPMETEDFMTALHYHNNRVIKNTQNTVYLDCQKLDKNNEIVFIENVYTTKPL